MHMSDTNVVADGLEQLSSLEEKINQTIDLLRSTRADKEDLRRENATLRHECEEQGQAIQKLEERVGRLEKERDTVRGRVQKLLEQVDSLTRE
jgi:FtsZ-binding cell division protein ZapB